MPIRVKCGTCKKTLSVKEHLAGKKIKCPVCQSAVVVSSAAPAAAPKAGLPAKAVAPKATPPAAPSAPAKSAATGTKKPATLGKPANPGAKPTAPSAKKPAGPPTANGNGKKPAPVAPAAPEPPAPPPEEVEAEAASLFADEPAKEVDETPKTIDFKCEWCDEEVHLPLEMAGKQTQCPNLECRRIVKVPLPKVEKPKDWRKMDRRGPAAAIVNQPEQLDNAWGTEEAMRARQDSLAKAGAIELPPKPPLGLVGWMRIGIMVGGGLGLVLLVGVGIARLSTTAKQHKDIDLALKMVGGAEPRVREPVLAAEVHRTIAQLYLLEGRKAVKAWEHLGCAQVLAATKSTDERPVDAKKTVPPGKKEPDENINEQLFLIDLALAQIELGGTEEEVIAKNRRTWESVRADLDATLKAVRAAEARVMAVRAVTSRLLEKKQADLAFSLAGGLSNPDLATQKRSPVLSQQIALHRLRDEDGMIKKLVGTLPDFAADKELTDPQLRVGYADGFARKGSYEEALKIALMRGPSKDRLDACLGVAAIAWSVQKKDEADKCVKEALKIVTEARDREFSPWLFLHLVRVAARTEEVDAVKELIERLRLPEAFKLRAQMELVLAQCDKAAGPASPDILIDLIANESDKDGTTLALAWNALAQQNARRGASRAEIQKAFADRADSLAGKADRIRPLVEIGSFHGMLHP